MTKKILLLIEDNPLLTGLYKTAFEKKGAEVIFAHNGEEGIELAEERKPNLIVLDLLMPGMDGFEVLSKIKNNPTTKKIKVVILTVVSKKETKEKAMRLGALDYLIKTDLELNEIVDRVISRFEI